MMKATLSTIDQAMHHWNAGDLDAAAAALHSARMEALSHSDTEELSEVDRVRAEMRDYLSGKELTTFDRCYEQGFSGGKVENRLNAKLMDLSESAFRSLEGAGIQPRQLALGLLGLGTLGVLISEFMPLASSSFPVAENQIIQHHGWIALIVVAASVWAALAERGVQSAGMIGAWIWAVLASAGAIYFLLINEDARTLVSLNPLTGEAIPGTESVASPGSGAYLMTISMIGLQAGYLVMRWVWIQASTQEVPAEASAESS